MPAALDELVPGGRHLGEGVCPGLDGRRQHDCSVAGDLGKGRLIAADHRGAERHRLEHGRPEAFVLGWEHERLGEGDQAVAFCSQNPTRPDDPVAESVGGDRLRHGAVGGTGTTEEDEHEVRIGPRPGEQLDEQPVALVWVGDRRIDDDSPPAQSVPVAQRFLGGECLARWRVVAVRYHDDPRRIGAERIDERGADEAARYGNRRSAIHGPRHSLLQEGAANRREVVRVAEVLDVVDGQQCVSASRIGRHRAAGVMDDVGALQASNSQRLGDEATAPKANRCVASDQLEVVGELRVGGGEAGRHEQAGGHLRGDRRQAVELANEVLLRTADATRPAPQQVHAHTHRRHGSRNWHASGQPRTLLRMPAGTGFWTERRVVVTGGAGFLGRRVVAALESAGADPVVVRSADYDLTEPGAAADMLADHRPAQVIHLAARVGGIGFNQAEPAPLYLANLLMGTYVIEAARAAGVDKTVLLGTVCSYPKFTPVPFAEGDLWNGYPEETNAPYGIAKKAVLVHAQVNAAQYGQRFAFLIPTNLYGPGDKFHPAVSHVIPALIKKCVDARERGAGEIDVWGTGSASREYLFVDDAARAVVLAAERHEGVDPINLGTNHEVDDPRDGGDDRPARRVRR